jgi:hypothetical protein
MTQCRPTPMRPRPVKSQRKFVGRKGPSATGVHAWSTTLGVTDLISSAGFTGTPDWRVLHQTPIEGRVPRPLKHWRCVGPWQARCHALETIPFPRTGPFNASGCGAPRGSVQLVPSSGEGQHTANVIDPACYGVERGGVPIKATGCRDAIHGRSRCSCAHTSGVLRP